MTTKELYTKGAQIWVKHPKTVWESGTVRFDFRSTLLFVKVDSTGENIIIRIKDENKMPPLRNPSLLIGQNDLTSLSYLHEPAVLHNLQVRFCDRNAIYTYCGIVLVAINPYCDLPIYGDETIMAYRGQQMGDLDPHIFAVSEEAYTKLEREERDQSIIVSGESGAGKTASAKYVMRYLAAVGGNAASEAQVERKVLASSPIMEAIGNAKTTRNDNSSRFGKFIEIHFDNKNRISGALMRTYLLEKSRVVYQSANERNYHIFYQLCAAHTQMPELHLDHQDRFQYLNQGGSPNIDGVNDLEAFNETRNALTTLGVNETRQQHMFKVLACILHLGNVELMSGDPEGTGDGEDGAYISADDRHLSAVCNLLGVSKVELSHWLTHRRIAAASEEIVSRMDIQRAVFAKDALAKRLYSDLFSWLVSAVNRVLDTRHAKKHFIGVLDIYGFETFEINSFEQFCINYANEKLQQQFNSHVFKLEQEEYKKEGISWTMIDFYDNQPCIDLIEDKPLGVLALLDEECRVPRGSDQGFVHKLHDKCANYQHLMKPRFGNATFIIKHYAGNVEYQSSGFLEKNQDTIYEEQLECIKSATSCSLIRAMCANECRVDQLAALPPPPRRWTTSSMPTDSPTRPQRRRGPKKKTVSALFRESLAELMTTLSATTPSFIRCIKPNDMKQAFVFDPTLADNQLRACGVLETIKISAASFPSRWLYKDFLQRFHLLCPHKDVDRNDIKATCVRILKKHIKGTDKYKLGTTKIFFRAEQVAYLEQIRADIQLQYCVRVQSCVRRFVARRKYLRLQRAVQGLQAHARGYLARRKVEEIRRNRAAIILQSNIRGWLARIKYQRLRRLAIGLQAHARGYLARKLHNNKKVLKATITIQRYCRGYLARKRVEQMRRQIVVVQSVIRGFIVRRRYQRLLFEARSQGCLVITPSKGLENKIISLQQRLDVAMERNKQIEPALAQIADLKAKLELLKLVEIGAKTLQENITHKDNLLSALRMKCGALRVTARVREEQHEAEKRALSAELEAERQSRQKLSAELEAERQSRQKLSAELEAERQSCQKLLSAQNELQERLDSIQRAPPKYRRCLSDASNNSQEETTFEDTSNLKSLASWNCDSDVEIINEDSALATAYKAQKEIIRQLQEELLNKEKFYSEHNLKTQAEIDRLREEIEKYQELLSVDLSSEPKTKEQEFAQKEIDSGCLAVEERVDKPSESCSRDKNQINPLVHKSVSKGDVSDSLESCSDTLVPQNAAPLATTPVKRKKEKKYSNMFKYKMNDQSAIIKKLILDLEPRTAVTLLPGLPAYIIFMMLRHMDFMDDATNLYGLIKAVCLAVKRTLKKHSESVEYNVFWLANMSRLLNILRQYSGEAVYQTHNTAKQKQHCLRRFDLSNHRKVLDAAVSIYQGLIHLLESRLEGLILPAVVEHEEIPGLSGLRSGHAKTPSPVGGRPTGPTRLKQELSNILTHLHTFALDPPLRCMIFKQLFYYICACSLNRLLLSKDLCCWAKGLQIRYNITNLETWIKEHLAELGQKSVEDILSVLRPVTQVVQLLQARKSMADVQSTVDMCSDLTTNQVCKILNIYTPAEEYEVRVTQDFIKEVRKKMQERPLRADKTPHTLLLDIKMMYTVQFPFTPSPIWLEDIELPEVLGLDGLLTKI